MPDLMDTSWPYPLVQTSESKAVPRPAVGRGLSAELVGFDGSLRGGLRPVSGMKRVYDLDFYESPQEDEASSVTSDGQVETTGVNHDETSRVLDCIPVNFRVGGARFVYGFVYRVARALPRDTVADVFIDYYDPENGVWTTGSDGNLIASGVSLTEQMDVQVFGRLVYVFISGQSPILFYLTEPEDAFEDVFVDVDLTSTATSEVSTNTSVADATDLTLVVVGQSNDPPLPGPGRKPLLKSPERAGILGSLVSTGDADRPAAGQVVLTDQSPATTGLFPFLEDNTFVGSGGMQIGTSSSPQVIYSRGYTSLNTLSAQINDIPSGTIEADDVLVIFVWAYLDSSTDNVTTLPADPVLVFGERTEDNTSMRTFAFTQVTDSTTTQQYTGGAGENKSVLLMSAYLPVTFAIDPGFTVDQRWVSVGWNNYAPPDVPSELTKLGVSLAVVRNAKINDPIRENVTTTLTETGVTRANAQAVFDHDHGLMLGVSAMGGKSSLRPAEPPCESIDFIPPNNDDPTPGAIYAYNGLTEPHWGVRGLAHNPTTMGTVPAGETLTFDTYMNPRPLYSKPALNLSIILAASSAPYSPTSNTTETAPTATSEALSASSSESDAPTITSTVVGTATNVNSLITFEDLTVTKEDQVIVCWTYIGDDDDVRRQQGAVFWGPNRVQYVDGAVANRDDFEMTLRLHVLINPPIGEYKITFTAPDGAPLRSIGVAASLVDNCNQTQPFDRILLTSREDQSLADIPYDAGQDDIAIIAGVVSNRTEGPDEPVFLNEALWNMAEETSIFPGYRFGGDIVRSLDDFPQLDTLGYNMASTGAGLGTPTIVAESTDVWVQSNLSGEFCSWDAGLATSTMEDDLVVILIGGTDKGDEGYIAGDYDESLDLSTNFNNNTFTRIANIHNADSEQRMHCYVAVVESGDIAVFSNALASRTWDKTLCHTYLIRGHDYANTADAAARINIQTDLNAGATDFQADGPAMTPLVTKTLHLLSVHARNNVSSTGGELPSGLSTTGSPALTWAKDSELGDATNAGSDDWPATIATFSADNLAGNSDGIVLVDLRSSDDLTQYWWQALHLAIASNESVDIGAISSTSSALTSEVTPTSLASPNSSESEGRELPDHLLVCCGLRYSTLGSDEQKFDDEFEILLLDPEHQATNVGIEARLVWRGRFPDGTADPSDLVYDLYFGQIGAGEPNVVATLDGDVDTFDPGTLYSRAHMPFGTEFIWYIKARLTDHPDYEGKESAHFTFTTESEFDSRMIEPGDYVFSYMLYDRRTGRQSSLSVVAQAREEDFQTGVDEDGEPQFRDLYAALEVVYDSTKFDQMYIYRSVKVQDAGGTLVAAWQQLDRIVELENYHTILNEDDSYFPDDQPFRHSIYYYSLEDKQMTWQPSYPDIPDFDSEMPYGGTAVMYDNTMIVGRAKGIRPSTDEQIRRGDSFTGLGELRWSSIPQLSPELFPPGNRYVPSVPSNEIIRLTKVGGNVLGFSRDRMYHIRRESGYLHTREMHEGFLGLLSHRGVDVAGSTAYVVTSKGVKVVDAFAKLDHLKAMDVLMKEEWLADLDQVSVAFDPFICAMFFHNPVKEQTAVVWLDTAVLTELHDMNMVEVRQGSWPKDPYDYDAPLVERALFVQNVPYRESDVVYPDGLFHPGKKPGIFIVDYDRNKTWQSALAGGGTEKNAIRLMDYDGPSRLHLISGSDVSLRVTEPAGTTIDGARGTGGVATGGMVGGYVYILSASDESLVGTKALIVRTEDGESEVGLDLAADAPAAWSGLVLGDRVGVSPVYCRWVGHNVALQTEEGYQFGGVDFHRVKQVNDLIASFVDVDGPALNSDVIANIGEVEADVYFRGLLYEGTDTTTTDAQAPRDENNQIVRSISAASVDSPYPAVFGVETDLTIKTGKLSVSLSPGLEVYCPDVDFRLLGVLVSGRIRPETDTGPPTIEVPS